MANEEEEESRERSFKVADRRRFSATGEARPDVEDRDETPQHAETGTEAAAPSEAVQPDAGTEQPTQQADEQFPEITFSTFVISLSTQALAHLGEIPDPVDRSTRVDLAAARQIIDILGLLQDKTKGNLDSTEFSLLEGALYDLRMKYVERAKDH